MMQSKKTTDVVILGTGLSGTVLASILARNGVRVIMLDKATHPRFAIGESTITSTTLLFELLALRYDVPELNHLTNISAVSEHVQASSGVKLNFGFAYHNEGEEQRADQVNQALVVNELICSAKTSTPICCMSRSDTAARCSSERRSKTSRSPPRASRFRPTAGWKFAAIISSTDRDRGRSWPRSWACVKIRRGPRPIREASTLT